MVVGSNRQAHFREFALLAKPDPVSLANFSRPNARLCSPSEGDFCRVLGDNTGPFLVASRSEWFFFLSSQTDATRQTAVFVT